MKKRKIILVVFILLALSGFFAIAKNNNWFDGRGPVIDGKDELRKIFALYSRQDTQLYMSGLIRLYDKEEKNALKEETPFSYYRKDGQLYGQLGNLFYFMADTLMVQLDTASRVITISKMQGQQMPAMQTALPFEQFMQDTSTYKITATVEEERGLRKMTLTNEMDPKVKFSAIYYDPATYVIRKAEIAWWKQAMVYNSEDVEKKIWLTVMEYNYPADNGPAPKERRNEVVRWKKGKAIAGDHYSKYQVIENY